MSYAVVWSKGFLSVLARPLMLGHVETEKMLVWPVYQASFLLLLLLQGPTAYQVEINKNSDVSFGNGCHIYDMAAREGCGGELERSCYELAMNLLWTSYEPYKEHQLKPREEQQRTSKVAYCLVYKLESLT